MKVMQKVCEFLFLLDFGWLLVRFFQRYDWISSCVLSCKVQEDVYEWVQLKIYSCWLLLGSIHPDDTFLHSAKWLLLFSRITFSKSCIFISTQNKKKKWENLWQTKGKSGVHLQKNNLFLLDCPYIILCMLYT